MKNTPTLKILISYIIFIFALQAAAAFMPQRMAALYLSFAIIVMGLAAVFTQKVFHKQKFIDMGFRLNRSVLTGVTIGLIYSALILIMHYWLAQRLGLLGFKENPEFFQSGKPVNFSPVPTALVIGALGGIPLFIGCLFGEELVFRGYILPKLEEIAGRLKAIAFCVTIFALWHIPVYFSFYKGGALKEGPVSILMMLLAHAITAIPLCILYLRTRELYGVSFIHAALDVFQYAIIANPGMGEASRSAMYSIVVLNNSGLELFGWAMNIIAVFIMLWLSKIALR